MSILRILSLGAFVAMPLYVSVERAEAGAPRSIAIVYSLAGEASLATPDAARRSLRLFDRLPAGTALEVGPNSRLALAFLNGLRYELGKGSRVTLGPKDLASRAGPVHSLPRVPPFPRLAGIAKDEKPCPSAGAVRIRAERITGLYPRSGTATLAGESVLYFQPVMGAMKYRIEVQDGQGQTVFRADAESPPVKVPAGTLLPGHRYDWMVHTLDRPGAAAHGEAELVILSEDNARAREEARKILASEGPGSLSLLAEIDRGLGLLLEAREDLRTALTREPANPALRKALAEIKPQLEDADDHD